MDHKNLGLHETVDIICRQIQGTLPIGGIFYDNARAVITTIMQDLPLNAPTEAVNEAYAYLAEYKVK